jgi:hypothetical protein
MQNQPNPNQKQIQIKISDEVLKGNYANAMQISHTKEEFLLDFMNLYPQNGAGIVNSRVIMSPGHLKRAISAMQENLSKYEEQFGKIEEATSPEGIGFKAE